MYVCAFQSTGDPSLLLNYCREYWDGCSIAPLTSCDRHEVRRYILAHALYVCVCMYLCVRQVFSVFDRWRLEDYDVLAFSYSPLPTSPEILDLLQQHGRRSRGRSR